MYSKTLAVALALTSVVSASPLHKRQDPCQDTYKSCIASGVPQVACGCDLASCTGQGNARNREFCASATATIVRSTAAAKPVATSIPGGCNPAHPGSCPSSYFQTKTAVVTPSATDDCSDDVPTPSATGIPVSIITWLLQHNEHC